MRSFSKVRTGAVVGAMVLPVLLAAILLAPRDARAERYTLAGDQVAIYNLAGGIRIEPGTGSQVSVEVTRAGRDAADLRIVQGDLGDRHTLRVVYPGRRVIYPAMGTRSSSSVEVARDGTFGGHGNPFAWPQRRITVAGSGSGTEAHADLVVRVPAGTDLAVYLQAGRAEANDIEGDLRIEDSVGPVSARGIRGNLTLDTGSGSVEVRDVEGAVSLDTGSGAVTVENVHGPRLAADTGSGSVTILDARVDELITDTGSGGITLRGVTSRHIRLDTGSGHVDLGLASGCESLVVDTGSGGVTVRVPAGFGARYRVETGSGSIAIEVPHEKTRGEDGRQSGQIGDGRGSVAIDTGSGEVRILRAAK